MPVTIEDLYLSLLSKPEYLDYILTQLYLNQWFFVALNENFGLSRPTLTICAKVNKIRIIIIQIFIYLEKLRLLWHSRERDRSMFNVLHNGLQRERERGKVCIWITLIFYCYWRNIYWRTCYQVIIWDFLRVCTFNENETQQN